MKELKDTIAHAISAITDIWFEIEDSDIKLSSDTLNYLYMAENALRDALDSIPEAE